MYPQEGAGGSEGLGCDNIKVEYAVRGMRVPRNYAGKLIKAGLPTGLALLALGIPAARAADHQPVPWARVSLQKLGFPGVSLASDPNSDNRQGVRRDETRSSR